MNNHRDFVIGQAHCAECGKPINQPLLNNGKRNVCFSCRMKEKPKELTEEEIEKLKKELDI